MATSPAKLYPIVTLCLILPVQVCFAQGNSTGATARKRPDAQTIYKRFTKIARDLVKPDEKIDYNQMQNDGLYEPAVLIIDSEAKKVYFRLGGCYINRIGFHGDDYYALPFMILIDVENLRKAFNQALPDELFWKLRLEKMSQLAQHMLENIEKLPPKQLEIDSIVWEEDFGVEEISLQRDLQLYANQRRYTLDFPPGGRWGSPNLIEVSTDPPGGTIRILTLLNYEKCVAVGVEKDPSQWITLAQKKADLKGRIRYWVTWPDGKKAEGQTEVKYGVNVVFKPDR